MVWAASAGNRSADRSGTEHQSGDEFSHSARLAQRCCACARRPRNQNDDRDLYEDRGENFLIGMNGCGHAPLLARAVVKVLRSHRGISLRAVVMFSRRHATRSQALSGLLISTSSRAHASACAPCALREQTQLALVQVQDSNARKGQGAGPRHQARLLRFLSCPQDPCHENGRRALATAYQK